jgi:tetrahydromethanopterin S-methyltransferase subunit A
VATNLFHEIYPSGEGEPSLVSEPGPPSVWPPVDGEYIVLPGHERRRTAVSTLASAVMAEELARLAPEDLCIVGKTETENIGIEKIIKNTVTNPSLHVLVVAGRESDGHRSGATLLSLCRNGVDANSRVIGSPGPRPVLKNVTSREIEAFRRQVTAIDMIGCEDPEKIAKRIVAGSDIKEFSCGGTAFARTVKPVAISTVDVVQAKPVKRTKLDKTGYFVILPLKEKGKLSVEHYSNDNRLLRIIEGEDAVGIYRTIVENGWVTQLSHAAYLGRELDRAELSMKLDFRYVQDGIG